MFQPAYGVGWEGWAPGQLHSGAATCPLPSSQLWAGLWGEASWAEAPVSREGPEHLVTFS